MASVRAWNHYGNWLVAVSLFQAALLVKWISNLCKGVDVNNWLTLVPVFVTALLFFILLLKVAHEFYVQGLKSENVEEDEVFLIREKPKRFVIFILAILAIFVSAVIIIVKQNSQIGDLQIRGGHLPLIPTNLTAQSPSPKPLPDQIIPALQSMPSVVTQQMAVNQLQTQFETNSPTKDGSDSESELAAIKAKKLAAQEIQKENDKKQRQDFADERWNRMLPIYKDCIETLYNLLKNESDRRGEGIAKTLNYFSCLPATLDVDAGETNVAEIKFQTQTNMDFKIYITGCDTYQQRGLRIECAVGRFEIRPSWLMNSGMCNVEIHIIGLDDNQDADIGKPQQIQDLTAEDLKILRDAQTGRSSPANQPPMKQ